MNKLNNLSGKVYLSLLCAENYPEQESAYKLAKWYDLLWLLIPMIGIIFFLEIIKERYQNENSINEK